MSSGPFLFSTLQTLLQYRFLILAFFSAPEYSLNLSKNISQLNVVDRYDVTCVKCLKRSDPTIR